MTLRIGIIGCGGIAKAHIKGFQKNGARITALADVNPEAAKTRAQDAGGGKIFSDFRVLIDSGDVDAVSICTPPVAHEEAAIHALSRGVHVLCEKPLAHTVEAGRRMAEAAGRSKAVLMVAYRHRYLPYAVKIRSLIHDGTVGPLVFFQNVFCGPAFDMKDKWFSKKAIAGGGTIMDTSSHSVDLFRFLAGEVIEQRAVFHRHLTGTDVEDASVLALKSESGAVGSLIASWVAGSGAATVEVMGQNARLVYDYNQGAELKMKKRGEKEWQTLTVENSNGFPEETAHFLKAARGEEPCSCSARDGLRALEIIHAVYAAK